MTEYAPGASGNVTPIATISASSFGDADPGGLAIDSSGDLYVPAFVPNTANEAVYEFAPGASGAATPIATITGSSTGLSGPADVVLNSAGNIIVANSSNDTITTYAAGASGNAAPTNTLDAPGAYGIGLDPSGDLFDAFTGEQQGIDEYAPGATGNATPIATIAGSNTGIGDPAGVLIAPAAPPAQLAFISGPASGPAGQALSTQPAVAIENAAGNVVKTDTSHVKLSLTTVSGNPAAVLRCTTNPVTASAGVATFAGCTVGEPGPTPVGGTYVLRATDGSLTSANSVAFTISTPLTPAISLAWNTDPVAEPGTLNAGQKVPLTVTARRGTRVFPGALVYLSLTRADVTPGHPDNATAECGTTRLPAYCHADAKGQVAVSYQAATTAGTGSDTLTAALDPYGTDQATDQYTYPAPGSAKVTALSWNPGPVAPAGTLAPGHKVTVRLAALAADGAPVPSAHVQITFTEASGSDAAVSGKGCTGNDTGLLRCQTDSSGHVNLTYTSARNLSRGGSDALQASTSPAGPGTPTALDTYAYDKISSLGWSTDPIAEAGTLAASQKVSLTVTARSGAKVAPGAVVYLSLTRADVTPGHPDDATAECGTTRLPAYCHANAKGQVLVTYQAASKAGAGSDTLTAALDPFGTGEATDQYTYATSSTAKITGLRWDPSPIAAAGTLAPGDKVTIHLAALAAGGAPVPSASVQIALTQAAGSDATVSAKGCTGNDTGLLRCETDSTGHVTITYTSARNLNPGGSDTLQATTSPTPGSATATDTYAYAKIGSLVWSTDPVTEAGTLGAGQKVPLTVTARNGTKPVTRAMVYLSLTRADVTPGVPDNATARCGTTALPAYCRTNAHGQVQVTYQTATTPGTGSDTLTAALDPFGTGQATDQYTYAAASASKITGLSLDPSPIAPAGTLAADRKMIVSMAALAAHGRPVPSASVQVTFTPAPGSDATISGKGCTGSSTDLRCQTDSTGHVTLTYISAGSKPSGGSDAIQVTTSPPVPGSPIAVATYSYLPGLP